MLKNDPVMRVPKARAVKIRMFVSVFLGEHPEIT